MVAEILIDAGLDPTVIVGSFVKKFGSNFRAGGGEYLVVEADEYNRHFLNFHPFIGVVQILSGSSGLLQRLKRYSRHLINLFYKAIDSRL
jgi:hypothetical protein